MVTRATVLKEVRQMRFEEISARRQRRTLAMAVVGEMLGVTERTFRRWSGAIKPEARWASRIGGSVAPKFVRCWLRIPTQAGHPLRRNAATERGRFMRQG
ncbi:MAG: hypothetical protein ABL983_24820 [Nitrospira sp.]